MAVSRLLGLFLFSTATLAVAQQAPASVSNAWDTRQLLTSLADQAKRLAPLIAQVQPQGWIEKGAPEVYVAQWKTAENEVGYFVRSSADLAREPEKLSAALDTLFRLENLETTLTSLGGGIRRYQNPALADLLQTIMNQNGGNKEALKQYVRDLAATKEQEFQVADKEAQRCRAGISKQTGPTPSTRRLKPTERK